jgi:hypothetical protein
MFPLAFSFSIYRNLPRSTACGPLGDNWASPLKHSILLNFSRAHISQICVQNKNARPEGGHSKKSGTTFYQGTGIGVERKAGGSRRTEGCERNLSDASAETRAVHIYQERRRPPYIPYASQSKESSTSSGSLNVTTSSLEINLWTSVHRVRARSPPPGAIV